MLLDSNEKCSKGQIIFNLLVQSKTHFEVLLKELRLNPHFKFLALTYKLYVQEVVTQFV